jgi:hypothetical protein
MHVMEAWILGILNEFDPGTPRVFDERDPQNVKLLPPPRQSRGTSLRASSPSRSSCRKLLARVRAVLRRSRPKTERIVLGTLTVDFVKREAPDGDRVVDLTNREFNVLHYLAERPTSVVRRDEYCGRYGGTTLPSVRAPSITRWFACGGRSSAILTVPSSFTQWTVTGTV